MYTPSYYKQEDTPTLINFIREFPFGILVTSQNDVPWATHIPFVIEEEERTIVLYTHISAANPQGKQLENRELLCIFREPHAYISPTLYDHSKNVPTWNYVAVHAYGKAEILKDRSELINMHHKMISMLEPGYKEQFDNLPANYLDDLLKGITGIKITVTRLLGKEKLSQNKKDEEIERIGKKLSESDDSNEKKIGKRMLKRDGRPETEDRSN